MDYVIVNELGKNAIGGTVITGKNIGHKIFIPRMDLITSYSGLPFKFQKRQFTVYLCFAMTINKSQGQTLFKGLLFFFANVISQQSVDHLLITISYLNLQGNIVVLIILLFLLQNCNKYNVLSKSYIPIFAFGQNNTSTSYFFSKT